MPFISFEKKVDKWDTAIRRFPVLTAQIIGKTVLDAYTGSQIYVPVKTRTLKNSGQPVYVEGAQEGEIRYVAFYAGYVHEGTVKSKANPFLKKAVDRVLPSMIAAFRSLEGRLLA